MTDLLEVEVDTTAIIGEPGCAFCPQNGKVDIICEIGGMYLVHAKDEKMKDLPDRWLIIPAEHVESLEDLPIGWGESLVELIHEANIRSGFNLSLNIGADAGQTMPHLHWWLLDRSTDDLGKGMSWMISEIFRLRRICKELKARLDSLGRLPEDPSA
jgi:diadenosine tetraphosphate (Ap4A) HIT family hydrolase